MKHLNKYLEFRNEDMYAIRDEIDDKVRDLTSYLKDIGLDIFIFQDTNHHYTPTLDYIIVGMKSNKGIEWNKIKDDVIQTFEYLINEYELSAFIRVEILNNEHFGSKRFETKRFEDLETLYNENFILRRIEVSILNRK